MRELRADDPNGVRLMEAVRIPGAGVRVTGEGMERKQKKGHNIVTVLLQDYFHRAVFKQAIGEKQWTRFESRLDRNVDQTCELLDRYGIKATFFTLGWIGDNYPDVVRRIAAEGHEVASAGYWARSVDEIGPQRFEEDLARARTSLERAAGRRVVGYRCAYRNVAARQLWVLDVLAKHGYAYDASVRERLWKPGRNGPTRVASQWETSFEAIREFPVSTVSLLGFNVPIGGGNYLRQFPHSLMFRAFQRWIRTQSEPFVLYFHPWELDPEQPMVSAVGALGRMRQYRNLGKMKRILPAYFESAPFTSAADYLGVDAGMAPERGTTRTEESAVHLTSGPAGPVRFVSLVIPFHNEEASLPYLKRSLDELIENGRRIYEFEIVLVDDASTDGTSSALRRIFKDRQDVRIVALPQNRGVAGAILSGIRNASHQVECSMDADCSYDPVEALKMIPRLKDDVSMVTASPYHPEGGVLGVPAWRLVLSKSLSGLYRLVLTHKLHTYTSCFRVYRRDDALAAANTYGDFRGIVELLARMDSQGKRVVEYPTTLQSRIFGHSKMKTLRTIFLHAALLWRVMRSRRSEREFGSAHQRAQKTPS